MLGYRRLGTVHITVFISEHLERTAHDFQQFAGIQQELGPRRAPILFVAQGKRFVNQQAPGRNGRQQGREQGAMQVVGDNDRRVFNARKWPGRGFNIGLEQVYPRRCRRTLTQGGNVTINGINRMSSLREQARVATRTAGNVKHSATGVNLCGKTQYPGRRRIGWGMWRKREVAHDKIIVDSALHALGDRKFHLNAHRRATQASAIMSIFHVIVLPSDQRQGIAMKIQDIAPAAAASKSADPGAQDSANLTRLHCAQRDADDPLRHARDRFDLPANVIYLDGNSLGALPRATAKRLDAAIRQQWGQDLIRSWNSHSWVDMPQRVAAGLARLLGAKADEVIVADSTSVNLFKLLAGELQRNAVMGATTRRVILSEAGNFPSDLYMAQGINALLGDQYRLRLVEPSEVETALDESVAVAMITQVDYRSGRLHDMAALNKAARRAGTRIVWDLSHSAGAVPLALNADGAELAVGCGYKYLNGGPGAPGYLYVAKPLQANFATPLSGWFGHASPFSFETAYRPAPGIERFLCGTPSILATLALDCGIATFDDIEMHAVREKSLALADCFRALMDRHCAAFDFRCIAPSARAERGSQLSFAHEQAWAIMQAIIDRGVIGDFRQPNLLRFGFTPLYTRFVDIWDAVMTIREVMQTEAWRAAKYQQRNTVT